jgi:UDP-N-acetylglucosamine:LPS N-acetylglucosamine transferase
MKKKKKLLFLVNNLSFFISHRLSIAEAAIAKGYDIFIGYGKLGDADLKLLEKKNFKVNYIEMHSSSFNIFKDFKTIFYIWKFFKKCANSKISNSAAKI